MVLTARLGQDARPMIFAFLPPGSRGDFLQRGAFGFGGNRLHPVRTWPSSGRLNFGDCMSYAVASVAGMPLLFTGEDFRRTDIRQA
jgi:uncharacterized protein with PIN domain